MLVNKYIAISDIRSRGVITYLNYHLHRLLINGTQTLWNTCERVFFSCLVCGFTFIVRCISTCFPFFVWFLYHRRILCVFSAVFLFVFFNFCTFYLTFSSIFGLIFYLFLFVFFFIYRLSSIVCMEFGSFFFLFSWLFWYELSNSSCQA
jgi:hypothetical protein